MGRGRKSKTQFARHWLTHMSCFCLLCQLEDGYSVRFGPRHCGPDERIIAFDCVWCRDSGIELLSSTISVYGFERSAALQGRPCLEG